MADKSYLLATAVNWVAWVQRTEERRDREDAARKLRFLDLAPADLQGVTAELRTELSDRLRRVAKGA